MNEQSSQPVRILVVDDDPAIQHMGVDYFEQHDVSAVSASGRETMASALDEPSLVILDLRLGHEDGLDLLRETRSRSDVPVIITTGHRSIASSG
jgi:two-component system, OmpR family, response regulator